MTWTSRRTGNYCHHPDDAWQLLLHGGQHWEACDDCGKTWLIGILSPEQAAAFQTAIDCGRSWSTAMKMANDYEPRNITVPLKSQRDRDRVRR